MKIVDDQTETGATTGHLCNGTEQRCLADFGHFHD
jgi:hypothetical protein